MTPIDNCSNILTMQRQKYLDKVTQRQRNLNIARLYFEEDKTTTEIQMDYPDLSRQRITQIAHQYMNKYKEEQL